LKYCFPHKNCVEEAYEIVEKYGGRKPNFGEARQKEIKRDQDREKTRIANASRADKIKAETIELAGTRGEEYFRLRYVDGVSSTRDIKYAEDITYKKINRGFNGIISEYRDIKGNLTGGIHRIFLMDTFDTTKPPKGGLYYKKLSLDKTSNDGLPGCIHLAPI